jgi:hypothetical protein
MRRYSGFRVAAPRSHSAKWPFSSKKGHLRTTPEMAKLTLKPLVRKTSSLKPGTRNVDSAGQLQRATAVSELPYAEAILPSGLFLQKKAALCDLENGTPRSGDPART